MAGRDRYHQGLRRRPVAAAVALAVISSSCASSPGYERELASARAALDAGDSGRARALLEGRIGRRDAGGPEAALLRLELATVALQQGDHAGAATALAAADPLLEVVDLTRDDHGEAASWLFSDAARPYRSPPYEKLMVNILGLASRLHSGDLGGALVEARRLEVLSAWFRDSDSDPGRVLGVGHLLAGVAHAAAGRRPEATLFLDRARISHPELLAAPWWHSITGRGDLYLIVLRGRVPRKVERLVPAAEAARRAGMAGQGEALASSGTDSVRLVELSGVETTPGTPGLLVDGRLIDVGVAADLDATARRTFERAAPTLARAAVTRALSRRAARRGLGALDAQPPVESGRLGIGAFLGGLTAGAMELGDVLDTRCWSGLPARIHLARVLLSEGEHEISVGAGQPLTVRVTRGKPTVVLLTAGLSE